MDGTLILYDGYDFIYFKEITKSQGGPSLRVGMTSNVLKKGRDLT
jgi:hypothetical protein